jgi:hypothetical protein
MASSDGFTRDPCGAPEQGADTVVRLCTAPGSAAASGDYFTHRREQRPGRQAHDDVATRWLWETSAHMTG